MSNFAIIAAAMWATLGAGIAAGLASWIVERVRLRRLVAFCRSGREW